MPTYQTGDGWVSLANQKHYVSLYTCEARHLAAFKVRHPDIGTGKTCIRFRATDELPTGLADVIGKALGRRAALPSGGHR